MAIPLTNFYSEVSEYEIQSQQFPLQGRTIVTKEGQEKYEVYIRSQKAWVEVTAEVFERLTKDIDCEMNSNWRYHKRSVSVVEHTKTECGDRKVFLTAQAKKYIQLARDYKESLGITSQYLFSLDAFLLVLVQ